MTRPKRYAVGLLLCGVVLAVGTPVYVAYAQPGLKGYLLHPINLLLQVAPYLLCAVLWLPRRAPKAANTALTLSALLLLIAVVLYLPMLWAPGAQGGDMIALAFGAISAASTAVLLFGSALALLVPWLRTRNRPGRSPSRKSGAGDNL
jgi:hypothetical protein